MRIGITCYPTYGGSGAVATELGLELGRRGHEVHIISYASPFRLRGGFAQRVTFHEVVPADYPLFEHSPYALALAVKQHEVALREDLQLMHAHYAIPHAATAWLAKQMLQGERDLKVVTTLHGTDITLVGQDPSYFTITKFSIEHSDRVTAVSEYLREETYRAFGCAGCDVRVIPNFVSSADFHPSPDGAWRRALAPAGHKILLHVSNFRPVKRIADVIRVFAGVRRAPSPFSRTARPTSGCVAPRRRAPSSSRASGSCRATKRSIRTYSMLDVLRLVRAHNLLVAAAGVLAGGWIALGALATPKLVVFAAVAGVAFGAAGNALNDIWNAAADRVTPPPVERPLAAG